MAKYSYNVTNPQIGAIRPRKNDQSFSSCLCVMLTVLTICLLLSSLMWYYSYVAKKGKADDNKEYERLQRIPEKEETTKKTVEIEETSADNPYSTTENYEIELGNRFDITSTTTENKKKLYKEEKTTTIAQETTTRNITEDTETIIRDTTTQQTTRKTQFSTSGKKETTIDVTTSIEEETTVTIDATTSKDAETTTVDATTQQTISEQNTRTTQNLPSQNITGAIKTTTEDETTLGEIETTIVDATTSGETQIVLLRNNLEGTTTRNITEDAEITTIDSTTLKTILERNTRITQNLTSPGVTKTTTEDTTPSGEIETAIVDATTSGENVLLRKSSEETTRYNTEKAETTTIDAITQQTILERNTRKTKDLTSNTNNEETKIDSTTLAEEQTSAIKENRNRTINSTIDNNADKLETTTTYATTKNVKIDKSTTLGKREVATTAKGDEDSQDYIGIELGETEFSEITTFRPLLQNVTKSNLELNSFVVNDEKKCNSSLCALTAARIISSMDLSKTPCENFYEFACGGVQSKDKENIDIFASKLFAGDIPDFAKKFQTFYKTCVRHEDRFHYETRIERAKYLLSKAGLFQFDGQSNTTYNVTEFVGNLILFKSMPFFEVGVDIEPENSTYILKLLAPDLTSIDLEHWSTLLETKRKCLRETDENAVGSGSNLTLLYEYYRECQTNYSDYLDSIESSVRELGIFSNLTDVELNKHIKDIRYFIKDEMLPLFDNIGSPPNLQESLVRRWYVTLKLKDLNQRFPLIQWDNLFKMLINNDGINDESIIQMYNVEYFEKVLNSMYGLDKGKLNNAFLAILANSLFENTILPVHKHSRIEYCKDRSTELMPDIVNYLYKKSIPASELKEHNAYIEELYNTLKKQFIASLGKAEWLKDEEDTKTSLKKKLDNIQLALFRTEDVENEEKLLEKSYIDLNLENDYQINLFNLMEFRRRRLFSIQGQKATTENTYRNFVDATKEEPVFFYANDIVFIPYGLTRRATKNLPAYLIMAQVGFPLAKVIGHAFDSVGIHYRVKLSTEANETYSEFADNIRDVIRMSNPINFGERRFDFTVNNGLSESERMAENTALRLVTDSFHMLRDQPLLPWIPCEFSREKVFFIAIAQEFCRKMSLTEFMLETYESSILPPQFRIENILGNSEEFWKQYNCPEGSTMTRIQDHLQFPFIPIQSDKEMEYDE